MQFVFSTLFLVVGINGLATRLQGSKYPVSSEAPSELFQINQASLTPGQYLMMVSLSGLLAQQRPVLFLIPSGGNGNYQSFWLSLMSEYNISVNKTFANTNNIKPLVTQFLDQIEGYNIINGVNYTANQTAMLNQLVSRIGIANKRIQLLQQRAKNAVTQTAATNFANQISTINKVLKAQINRWQKTIKYRTRERLSGDISILNGWAVSSVNRGLLVTPDLIGFAQSLGLTLLEDLRIASSEDIYSIYGSELNKDIIVYQDPSKFNYLGDYATFSQSFAFNSDLTSDFAHQVFSEVNANSPLFGWGPEADLVSSGSEYNLYIHAADWALNLPVYSNLEVHFFAQVHLPLLTPIGRHTVAFLFTDGDNVQWMINGFATDSRWFGSSKRGQIPIGWTLTPALSEIAPNIMDYLYNSATSTLTGSDTFVSAPSGHGYMDPHDYSDDDGYTQMLNQYLDKADMQIVNILEDSNVKTPSQSVGYYTQLSNVEGIIYYQYNDYSMLKGAIYWMNDKPIVGGRANLWQGFNTPQQMATLINNIAKQSTGHNEQYSNAYSLIPVHAWSMTLDDVLTCASLLDSNYVRVVSPSQLISLIKDNVVH